MSALESLIGVGCALCRRNGHFCQAQMWEECEEENDGKLLRYRRPLCLRCADGEECCWETAQKQETPKWLEDEADPCVVPKLTEEDQAFVAAQRWTPERSSMQGKVDATTRGAILGDLETMTIAAIAEKYHVEKKYVMNLRSNQRYKKRRAAWRKKRWELVEKTVRGELVRMAPMVSMGAETVQ
jgi:hypothetical protein